ncbi:MAG: hypothetical protein IJY38_02510, partial [Clostridia bacterium]|nr:hypothetical protein [Clostridia bacterium]
MQEKFDFAKKTNEQREETVKKSVGYMKDALSRFVKNKASVVAFAVILFIFAFSLFTPLFNRRIDSSFMDTAYAKKSARNLTLKKIGIADGGIEEDMSERALINVIAIGMGAAYENKEGYSNGISLSDAKNEKTNGAGNGFVSIEKAKNEYLPLLKIKDKEKKNGRTVYSLRSDAYLKVCFLYMDVELFEYEEILSYQEETGIPV